MKKIGGFTFIEVMLALTLSFIILNVLIAVFATAEKNFQIQTQLSRIQEDARLATAILTPSLQIAGFIGCAKLTADFPLDTHGLLNLTRNNRVTVNINRLSIWHASIEHAILTKTSLGTFTFYLPAKMKLTSHNFLLFSDCQHAELLQIDAIQPDGNTQRITVHPALSAQFAGDVEVRRLEQETFFIEKKSAGRYALYKQDNAGAKNELMDGFAAIVFQLDSDGNGVEINWLFPFLPGSTKSWFSYIALRG